jgi:hypothetical protein
MTDRQSSRISGPGSRDTFTISVDESGYLNVSLSIDWDAKDSAGREIAYNRMATFTDFLIGKCSIANLMSAWDRPEIDT